MRCDVTHLLPDPAECGARQWALDWTRPCHWHTTRDTVEVRFSVNCSFADDAPRGGARVQPVDQPRAPPPGVKFPASLPAGSGGGMTAVSADGAAALFRYVGEGGGGQFGISADHWLLESKDGVGMYAATVKVYNFNRVGDNLHRYDVSMSDVRDGQLTGEEPFTFRVRVPDVPPRYFHGGRLYVEAGLLFSPNHTRRLFLDFTDYDPPALGPDASLRSALRALGAIFAVAVAAAAAVVCYFRRRGRDLAWRQEEHEHYD